MTSLIRARWCPSARPRSFTPSRDHPLPTLVPGVWHHIAIDAKLATSAGSLAVVIDGQPALKLDGIRTLTDGATAACIIVGAYTSEAPKSCTATDVRSDR